MKTQINVVQLFKKNSQEFFPLLLKPVKSQASIHLKILEIKQSNRNRSAVFYFSSSLFGFLQKFSLFRCTLLKERLRWRKILSANRLV